MLQFIPGRQLAVIEQHMLLVVPFFPDLTDLRFPLRFFNRFIFMGGGDARHITVVDRVKFAELLRVEV